ncbi:MAG TPA: Ig-like domain-containing protein [Verrucomicrobiae bacterium]|nr:Ig-like domain-containing protein [Verrucomicrobiae bacterium]
MSRRFVLLTLAIAAGVLIVAPARGAMLSGSFSSLAANSVVNLTTNGPLDWIHWGLYTATSLNRKAGVLPRISDFTELAAAGTNAFLFVFQVTDLAHGYSWSDGTPEPVVNDTHTGVWAYGIPSIGTGFEFTVPADTTMRTLKVYVGLFDARGEMTATLSDGSATAYQNNTLSSMMGSVNREYTFNYAAASAGQTLRIRWTLVMGFRPDANVTLHAAALSIPGGNNPPSVLLTNPANNANFPVGTHITLSATASDFDGTVNKVEFFADGDRIGQDTTSPYSASWTPSMPGRYSLTAEATDNDAATGSTLPVEVFVYATGGALAGTVANPPAQVNLTTEGTADWAHWGLSAPTSFDHKSGVGQSISDFTVLGSHPVMQYSNNYTRYSWSDGTPVLEASATPTGVFIIGQDSGFHLTVPADTTPRRLKLYVGGYGMQANFQAWLSDFSAAAYTDTSVSNVFDDAYAVYTLDYAAASAGESLIVQYRADTLFDGDFGNVTLQAATLTGPPAALPVTIVNPTWAGGSFTFSFPTEAGKSYYALRATSLVSLIDWQPFTNVAGNGSMATVTDANLSATRRFYRVHQP